MDSEDRSLALLHLRKTFTTYLKEPDAANQADPRAFDRLLPLFSKVSLLWVFSYKILVFKITRMFTPDDLLAQFKEIVQFSGCVSDSLVLEIRRRANNESTKEAAAAIYDFLKKGNESRGWDLLKTISFLVST